MILKALLCICFTSLILLSAGKSMELEKNKARGDLSPMMIYDNIKSYDLNTNTCNKYFCKNSSMTFSEGTCAYENVNTNSIYVQKCNGNYECIYSGPSTYTNYTCVMPINPNETSFPGGKCNTVTDCYPNPITSCTNGICIGAPLNTYCQANYQCNPGLYCSGTNKCIPQLPIGSYGCLDDDSCVNGAGCNSTATKPGVCRPYFSIPPGGVIGSCNIAGGQQVAINYLCSSSLCAAGRIASTFICISPLESASPPPVQCSVNADCVSAQDPLSGASDVGSCFCSYNQYGSSYCTLFPGDTLYANYLSQFQKWTNSSAINKCDTGGRFDYSCISNWWDIKDYNTLINLMNNVQYYSMIQGAPKCVIETFFPEIEYKGVPFCPSFQCKLTNQIFENNQCVYYDGNQNFYVQACSSPSQVCNFTAGQNSTCVSVIKYPGQNCTFSSDCYTYACINGICQGVNEGSKCDKSAECNPGLYCSSNKCKPLKTMGEQCTSNSNCQYGSLCMENIQRCVPVRSSFQG